MGRLAAWSLLGLLAAGCAAELRPAPTATLVGGRGDGAQVSDAGVRLVARTGAWMGRPMALPSVVTPVLVTIENDSAHPLRLRYEDFGLVAVDGHRLAARAPFDIEGAVTEPSAYPGPPVFRPGLIGFINGRPVYALEPYFDPFYFDRFTRVELPTGDMVQFALREQTLEPGGRVSGFLYFDAVERADGQIDLALELVDARNGQRFGTLAIPFVVK